MHVVRQFAGPRLNRLSLAAQFLIASAAVLVVAMGILGAWVVKTIETGVVRHTAASTALFMDSFIEPLIQDLAGANRISADSQARILELLDTPLGERVLAIKIWNPDGSIAFSNDQDIIGRTFPMSFELQTALDGSVGAEFNGLEDEENDAERRMGRKILEIYSPVREQESGRIIGAAEFYEQADQLDANLSAVRLQTWLVVAFVTMFTVLMLFGIVRRGSNTIVRQQASLSEQVNELSTALQQNRELRARIAEANRRSAEDNEIFLRRVGADLHDGPAQLIGLSLLRLDTVEGRVPDDDVGQGEIHIIRSALSDAMQDIRNISSGLALPELNAMSLRQVVELVIRNHERRTDTHVHSEISTLPDAVPLPIKTCIYRFVQEGLNNAFKHAQGNGQLVRTQYNEQDVIVEVRDSGPGGVQVKPVTKHGSLGLTGMRDRIEALGGQFAIHSPCDAGTCLSLRFRLDH